MRRTVEAAALSLEGLARLRESAGQFRAADNNLRDQWMGETLVWLLIDAGQRWLLEGAA